MKPIDLNEMKAMIFKEMDSVEKEIENGHEEAITEFKIYMGYKFAILRITSMCEETAKDSQEISKLEKEIEEREKELKKKIFNR